jgi:hypothetical protein
MQMPHKIGRLLPVFAILAGDFMKSRIVEQLGQAELILPNLLAGALKANERAKLRMSVVQAVVRHVHDPRTPPPALRQASASMRLVLRSILPASVSPRQASPRFTAVGETDSLHRLVMDLHKVLNRMGNVSGGRVVA